MPVLRHSSPLWLTLGWHPDALWAGTLCWDWSATCCAVRIGGAIGPQLPNGRPRTGCQAGPKPLAVHAHSTPPLHATRPPRRLSTPQNIGEATPPGVELLLDELGTRVAVAFADAADARQWLGLWCSACAAAVVPPPVGSGLWVAPQPGSPASSGGPSALERRARATQIAIRVCDATVASGWRHSPASSDGSARRSAAQIVTGGRGATVSACQHEPRASP